jgi:hypothetical protein
MTIGNELSLGGRAGPSSPVGLHWALALRFVLLGR